MQQSSPVRSVHPSASFFLGKSIEVHKGETLSAEGNCEIYFRLLSTRDIWPSSEPSTQLLQNQNSEGMLAKDMIILGPEYLSRIINLSLVYVNYFRPFVLIFIPEYMLLMSTRNHH